MKRSILRMVLVSLSVSLIAMGTTTTKTQSQATEVKQTLTDIKKTLGTVPRFFGGFPSAGVTGAWEALKSIELGKTAIPGKYKSLIGIAVAAQIPCKYCVIFDTEGAKLDGATEKEINEAVTVSALVRHWSTVLNGMQTDETEFKNEVQKMITMRNEQKTGDATTTNSETTTAAEQTYREIASTVGFVPSFMKAYPEEGIAGAWKEFKNVQANPNSAIPCKYKELLGLAVSSQIPCHYCTYFHTENAKSFGATEREIKEAVAMAALTRHWSTYFHGTQTDEQAFRQDVTQIMKYLRENSPKTASTRGTSAAAEETVKSN